MKKAFFLLLYLTIFFTAGAQQLLHERSYQNNSFAKYLVSSAPDENGNILFSGTTLGSNGKFSASFLMVKPDADTLWTRSGPGNSPIEVQGIIKAPKDFLFYTIQNHPTISNTAGGLLQKLNGNGMPVWTKIHYANPGFGNGAIAALNMPDKGFILGGALTLMVKPRVLPLPVPTAWAISSGQSIIPISLRM